MKQWSGVIGHRESGVGIVEVMVAAAILSTAVGGTVYLTSSASQLGTSSNNVAQGAELGASVVEVAQFKPDASYVSSQISSMQTTSSSNSFTLDGVAVSSAGSTDSVSVTVSWTNPFIDNANKTQRFTLGSSVTANTSFQTIAEAAGSSGSGSSPSSTFTVSTSAGTGTTITPTSAQVTSGGTTSFTVGLASGYDTLVVSGCGGTLVGSTYTTGVITSDCTVTTSATEVTYSVSTSSGTGVASLSCNSATVSHGGSTSCSATLATGYENLSLSGCNGTPGGSPYSTGAIYADCTVTASASAIVYTVSTSIGTGTTLSPSSAAVSYGATTSFTAGTTGGYTNLSVSGCFSGALVGATYTTGAITDNCVVTSSASVSNQAPIAVADTGDVYEDGTLTVDVNLLSNDSDPDGNSLSVTNVTGGDSYGALSAQGSGVYRYTLDNDNPSVQALNASETLTEVYTYTLSDGSLTDTATLTITINGADEPVAQTIRIDATKETGNGQYTPSGCSFSPSAGSTSNQPTCTVSGTSATITIDPAQGICDGANSATLSNQSVLVDFSEAGATSSAVITIELTSNGVNGNGVRRKCSASDAPSYYWE